MFKLLIVFLSFLISVHKASAQECPSCKGQNCPEESTKYSRCNFTNSPKIPHQKFYEISIAKNPNYACLDLEYTKGDDAESIVQRLKQCVIIKDNIDICNNFQENIRVIKCEISLSAGGLDEISDFTMFTHDTTVTEEFANLYSATSAN